MGLDITQISYKGLWIFEGQELLIKYDRLYIWSSTIWICGDKVIYLMEPMKDMDIKPKVRKNL